MTVGRSRLLQLIGLVTAMLGLLGYWFSGSAVRANLSESQKQLLNLDDKFHASFVVAGKDIHYDSDRSTPIYNAEGEIIAWNYTGSRSADGSNTDTILYVQLIGNEATVIAIPRDLHLPGWETRINGIYGRKSQGAQGLKRAVEEVLGLPIDYYAIINTDIFEDFVNALDGVEVNIKYPMHYDDHAGNLHIHFEPGLRWLSGEDAIKFIRYRKTARGDHDRLDNVKALAYAMLARIKELHVRAALKLPELMNVVLKHVETNMDAQLAQQLISKIQVLSIRQMATLPGEDARVEGIGAVIDYDQKRIEDFLAETFGGKPRIFSEVPDMTLLITNRSSLEGLQDFYKSRLVALGMPADNILTRTATPEPTLTRLLATEASWREAEYFTSLLQTGRQQIDTLSKYSGKSVDLEFVLGDDVALYPLQHARIEVHR